MILDFLKHNVLLADGAMGTITQALDLSVEKDYLGKENCTDVLTLSRPDLITQIHTRYFEAGADAVETNTFGASKLTLAEFELEDKTIEINTTAAQLARTVATKAAAKYNKPCFVLGSVGPGTKLASLGHIDYQTLEDSFYPQFIGLAKGKVDAFLIETCQDPLQIKAAINAGLRALEKTGENIPLFCQVTMETTGTMLVGTSMGAVATVIDCYKEVELLGLNCATGPQEMTEHLKWLSQHWHKHISVLPNAGLPEVVDGKPHYPLTPEELALWHKRFITELGVGMIGGCCGTTTTHIKALDEMLRTLASDGATSTTTDNEATSTTTEKGTTPQKPTENHPEGTPPKGATSNPADKGTTTTEKGGTNNPHRPAPIARSPKGEPSLASLYERVALRQENSFFNIGERCNANGSLKFRQLQERQDWEGCIAMARDQQAEGSNGLDICTAFVGRDELKEMHLFIAKLRGAVQVPLFFDSTEYEVLADALALYGGKGVINSINFEDGEQKPAERLKLARKFAAAVLALTIDEKGMAKTATEKLRIAKRLRQFANHHGIQDQDLLFDPLTFTICTGNESDRKLGLETLEGIRLIANQFPKAQIVIGVSNISFGINPPARRVLNSAFLNEAIKHGLTGAISHTSGIVPLASIDPKELKTALDLIYDKRTKGYDPLSSFLELFANQKLQTKKKAKPKDVKQRLKHRIIDGDSNHIEKDLKKAMEKTTPLDIINTILLEGMKVVGELFGSGKMQLPFVLRSAETMKAAVRYLEPFMEKTDETQKGTIVLATVKGDVHDIGKNLVDIILSNNGYKVINLGIKQPISDILTAVDAHKADVVGMSGLLVKSTAIMRENLEEMEKRNLKLPVLLGGAALNRRYVVEQCTPAYEKVAYAKDAFDGLAFMDAVQEGAFHKVLAKQRQRVIPKKSSEAKTSEDKSTEDKPATKPTQPEPTGEPAGDQTNQPSGKTTGDKPSATKPTPAKIAPAKTTPIQSSPTKTTKEAKPTKPPIKQLTTLPTPPFWGGKIVEHIPLANLLRFLNTNTLYQFHWGYKKEGRTLAQFTQWAAKELKPLMLSLSKRYEQQGVIWAQAGYGYFGCRKNGNGILVFSPDGNGNLNKEPIGEFTFPRQSPQEGGRCISDFFSQTSQNQTDVLALQAVTVGKKATEKEQQLFKQDKYQDYLYLHGLAVEYTEAAAEYIHRKIRLELGLGAEEPNGKYRGCRYSFGYPACPNIHQQELLLKLLDAHKLGIEMSDTTGQLVPEQSTTAVVVHHPEAGYFTIKSPTQ